VISPKAVGYANTPGLWSQEQAQAWNKIVKAVHAQGSKIVVQLWHVGRISHPDLLDGDTPVAPSAIQPAGEVSLLRPKRPFVTPRALSHEEIQEIVAEYKHAAELAKAAGFDGVEIHAANGYLLDQFLQDSSNQRQDQYGGSFANRTRLLLEVLDEVIQVWGSDRVGVRLSPYGIFNDMSDKDPVGLFTHVIEQLNPLNLAYLHLIEPRSTSAGGNDELAKDVPSTSALFKKIFKGKVIMAGGYERDSAEAAVSSGEADAVAFGRLYISNPDLLERFAQNAALTPYDRSTFYGGTEKGYTDYPSLT
jgi:N-ethylmaleimide reductase